MVNTWKLDWSKYIGVILILIFWVFQPEYLAAYRGDDSQAYGFFENWTGYSFEKEEDQVTIFDNRIRLKIEENFGDYKAFGDFTVGKNEMNESEEIDSDIHELYFDLYSDNFDMRFGKQFLSWGVADGYFITDFSPLDLRRFIVTDFEDLRIGQSGIKTNIFISDTTTFELIWIANYEKSKIPDQDSEWSFISDPIFVIVDDDDDDDSVFDSSENAFKEYDVAFRLSGSVGTFDFSLVYFEILNNSPIYQKSVTAEGKIHLEETEQSTKSAGAYFIYLLNESLIIRGETLYTRNKSFDSTQFLSDGSTNGISDHDFYQFLIAMETNYIEDFTINTQYYQSKIANHNSYLQEEENNRQISIFLQYEFNDNLGVQWAGIKDLDDSGLFSKLEFKYNPIDKLEMKAGYVVLDGEEDTYFGQFDDNDFIYFKMRYYFEIY